MTCHNLATTKKALLVSTKLLGLGARFCLQCRNIKKKYTLECLVRFEEDTNATYFARKLCSRLNDEVLKLHLKNNVQVLPRAVRLLKDILKVFKNRIIREFSKRR